MPVRIEVLSDLRQLPTLRIAWEALTVESTTPLMGLDATTGPLWFATLTQVFEKARTARIVIAR